jgi:hypothetical protein
MFWVLPIPISPLSCDPSPTTLLHFIYLTMTSWGYFFFSFLLEYVKCTKKFHSDVYTHAYDVLWSNSPSLVLFLIPLLPLLNNLTGFIILFSHMWVKYFDHNHSSFTHSFYRPLFLVVPHPKQCPRFTPTWFIFWGLYSTNEREHAWDICFS